MGWQTLRTIQMFFIPQDVNSWLCQAIGAGCCATGWVSRVNNNKHCLLSAYAGPEAVLFHLRPLDLSLHPSDEIATMVTIPILQMRKLKPRKLQQPRVAQLVVETLTQVCVTPASPHLPTGPYCFPRCYSLGTDKVNKQEHWALALALSLCVTSCVTSPGLNLPVYGMGMWSAISSSLDSGEQKALGEKSVKNNFFSCGARPWQCVFLPLILDLKCTMPSVFMNAHQDKTFLGKN